MPRKFWQILSGCLITVIVIGLLFIGKVFHDCTNGHHRHEGSLSATIDIAPHEKTIAFSANGTGGSDLYLLDMTAQKVTRLTDTEDFEYSPRFSPDGRKIVFVSGNEQTRPDKLFMMDLATRQVQKVTQGEDNDTNPAFIQGGAAILFCRQPASEYLVGAFGNPWRRGALHVMNLSTGKVDEKYQSVGRVDSLRSNTDGTVAVAESQESVIVINLLNGTSATIEADEFAHPAVDPTGKLVAYCVGQYAYEVKIVLHQTDRSGTDKPITSEPSAYPVFAPSGTALYYFSDGGDGYLGTRKLARCNLDGSDNVIIAGPDLFTDPMHWKPPASKSR